MTTTKIERIKYEWQKSFIEMSKAEGFRRILLREIGIDHYQMILKELLYFSREDSRMKKMATKSFFKTAKLSGDQSELIENDLKSLGTSPAEILNSRPLTATAAFIAFGYYLIQHRSAAAYLGYLFHLESMHPAAGRGYLKALERIGIPKQATTYIATQTSISLVENKRLENLIEEIIDTGSDSDEFIYGATSAAQLYGKLIGGAIEYTDGVIQHGLRPIAGSRM